MANDDQPLYKVVIDMTDDVYTELNSLAQLAGIKTVGVFFRRAASFYRWYILLSSSGKDIYVRTGERSFAVVRPQEFDLAMKEPLVWVPPVEWEPRRSWWGRVRLFCKLKFRRKPNSTLN